MTHEAMADVEEGRSPTGAPSGLLLRGDALSLAGRVKDATGNAAPPFDVVYLDPPYNVGVTFRTRRGLVKNDDNIRGSVAFRDSWGGIDGFLEMLTPRVASLRDEMAPHGVMWLHLDSRTVHDAKVLCDKIFGRPSFRGEIVWVPGNGARGRGVPSSHQTLLLYTRSAAPTSVRWNHADPALREPFAATSLEMHFTHVDADGRRYRERILGGKAYRYYADTGRARGSVWADIPAMTANTPLRDEATGYPTQKPVALLERVIRASSSPGDLIVDPMCGSGTTLVAAARLGRSFIGNDIGEVAVKVTARRLERAAIPFLYNDIEFSLVTGDELPGRS